jgi:hypothetical protein
MMSDRNNLAALSNGLTRRQGMLGVAIAFSGLALRSTQGWAETRDEISRTAESIHQEPVFKANRKRVYEALTDTQQFDKVIQLSGVLKSLPPEFTKPT